MNNQKSSLEKLFSNMHINDAWMDITFDGLLNDLTTDKASSHPIKGIHSIWELVNHIIFWRNKMYFRFTGNLLFKESYQEDWTVVSDLSEDAWKNSLKDLEYSQREFMKAIVSMKESQIFELDAKKVDTNYHLLNWIIQHDIYHFGQMVLLKKVVTYS